MRMPVLLPLLFTLATAAAAPALAGEDKSRELEKARQEVQRAREELRRAASELARVAREMDPDSPRAYAYEFMAHPKRAMLGVTIADGPEKDGQVRGVLITGVTPGGGAEKAGLKSGDLLLSANGQSLATKAGEKRGPQLRLREIMSQLEAGDSVKVDYEREGKRSGATIIASRQADLKPLLAWDDKGDFDVLVPPLPPVAPVPPVPPMALRMRDLGPDIGMQLAKLDPDLAPYFKTDRGVLVVKAPDAGSLGLKGGDVIVKIDGRAVDSPVDAWERFEDVEHDEKVKVDVVRQGKPAMLEGTLPERRHVIRKHIEIEQTDEP